MRARRRRGLRRAASGRAAQRTRVVASGLDRGVIASLVVLASIGLVMIYSTTAPLAAGRASPPHFWRHLSALAVGALCVAVAARVPTQAWRRAALPLWLGAALLLGLTLAFGVEVNGARRWLALPGLGITFQPGELAKWATVLAVAAVLAPRRRGEGTLRSSPARAETSQRQLLASGILAAVPVSLLVLQPDLGNALLLALLVGLLLFAAGARPRALTIPALSVLAGMALFVAFHPYALDRVVGFLDPWRAPKAEGFQLVQSFVAFGRGGLLGVGLGDGRQKLFYLPEAHTDFILAVVAEELGFVGVLAVLGGFAGLTAAGLRIARRADAPFGLLVAFGMTVLIAVPAAVNAAVVVGLLPTKGLTLPFLSYGRTSLLVCSLAAGQLLAVGRREAEARRLRIAAADARGLLHA